MRDIDHSAALFGKNKMGRISARTLDKLGLIAQGGAFGRIRRSDRAAGTAAGGYADVPCEKVKSRFA